MSLSTAILEYISGEISEVFTGLEISKIAGEFIASRGIDASYSSQGKLEAKAKFVKRIFVSLDEDAQQAGLVRHFVEKSPTLKTKNEVQVLLTRLAREYGEVSLSEEELEKRSELELLLTPYQDVLNLWQKVESFRASYQYRECLDSSRLALEVLLKRLLGNQKSIENQQRDFCQALGVTGLPNELVNSIWKSIADDKLFQNNQVKHDVLSDKVTDLEVTFIVNKTIPLMIYLIKKLG